MVVDPQTIRFEFQRANRELPLLAGGMPVFSRKWGMKPDGSRIPFDQLAFEKPIASGPYLIESTTMAARLRIRRDPHYWGATLPVRVGTNNFDRIIYKLYSDDTARPRGVQGGRVRRDWSNMSRATGCGATSARSSIAAS